MLNGKPHLCSVILSSGLAAIIKRLDSTNHSDWCRVLLTYLEVARYSDVRKNSVRFWCSYECVVWCFGRVSTSVYGDCANLLVYCEHCDIVPSCIES